MESEGDEEEQQQRASEIVEKRTPASFSGPSPLLVVRDIQDLSLGALGRIDDPFKWRATRVERHPFRMTVSALVGNLDQNSDKLKAACSSSCALLCCLIAEWILLHPSFSVPSTNKLDAILEAAADLVMRKVVEGKLVVVPLVVA